MTPDFERRIDMAEAIDTPSDKPEKEAWIHRFAVAVFMANHKTDWRAAQDLGERFWKDYKFFQPEDAAKAYSDP